MKKSVYVDTDLYLRLSREDEEKQQESNSIKNQKALLLDFLKRHPELRLRKIHVDDGYSGVSFERPAFQEMLADIKKGFVKCIVVKDLSRFGRNWLEVGEYVQHLFPFLGVRFISVNDNYDSAKGDTDFNDLILPVKNLMNESYARDISIMTKSSLETKRKNGEFVGAFTPYGYMRAQDNKNQLVIDEYAAGIVRNVFAWKIEGMNQEDIADKLNREGILAPSEYKVSVGGNYKTFYKNQMKSQWSAVTIQRILRNEVYIGNLIQGKRGSVNYKVKDVEWKDKDTWVRREHAHEAIVSDEEFALANRLLALDTRRSPGCSHVYLFSGILFCGDCRQNMIRKTSGKDKKYYYFICGTHKNDTSCCSTHNISAKRLEQAVLKAVQFQIAQVVELSEVVSYISTLPADEDKSRRIKEEIRRLTEEAEQLEKRKLRLYEHFSEDIISKEDYRTMNALYSKEINKIASVLKNREREKQALQNGSEKQRWMQLYQRYHNVKELDRRLVVTLIDRIYVYEDKRIEIVFRFRDEYNSLLALLEQAACKEAM
ncbi:MAG: recombinase family protein [Clostridia bacterium]|nr:recombinase family protein [Clostridia bacterium]